MTRVRSVAPRLVACAAIAWIPCALAAQRVASTSEVFLAAWVPEAAVSLGTIPAGEETLVAVGESARRGEFDSAAALLARFEGGAADPRARLSTAIWRHMLEVARSRVLSGGLPVAGDLELDRVERKVSPARLLEAAFAAGQAVRPDGSTAQLLSFLSVACADGLFPSLTVEHLRRPGPLPAILNGPADLQLAHCQTQIAEVSATAEEIGALNRAQARLFRWVLESRLAEAAYDIGGARNALDSAISVARAAAGPRALGELLLLRGDLQGRLGIDVLTFGYDLLSDQHFLLRIRQSGPLTDPNEYSWGDRWYREAGRLLREVGDSSATSRLLLRRALDLLLRDQRDSASILLDAIVARGSAVAPREYASAMTVLSVLRSNPSAFEAALQALLDRGDRAGAYSLGLTMRQYALRRYYQGDIPAALFVLRASAEALAERGLTRAASEALVSLADVLTSANRVDAGIDAGKQGVTLHNAFVSRLQSSTARYKAAYPTAIDSPMVRAEIAGLAVAVNQLAMQISMRSLEEGAPLWDMQLDTLSRNLERALGSFPEFALNVELGRALREQGASQATVSALYGRGASCARLREEIDSLEARASRVARITGDNTGLLYALTSVTECDPARRQRFDALLAARDPAGEIRNAYMRAVGEPGGVRLMPMNFVFQQAYSPLELALATDRGDLAARWVDSLDRLATDTTFTWARIANRVFRPLTLLANGEPRSARDGLIEVIRDSLVWLGLGPRYRALALDGLIDADAQLGLAEEGVWAMGLVSLEREEWWAARSGVVIDSRESAELAYLQRRAATGFPLSPEQMQRKRELERAQERAARRPPPSYSIDQATAALSALPPATTLLVYYRGRKAMVVWRADAGGALRVFRLPVDQASLSRRIIAYQRDLGERFATWKSRSAELYAQLVAPVESIPAGHVVAIVGAEAFGTLPFETLGPSPERVLAADHPIVYLSRIGQLRNGGLARADGAPVVVGVNGASLEFAESEADSVAGIVGTRPLVGDSASLRTVSASLRTARLVHFASHAVLEPSNAFASYIRLRGSDRLEAWQLFRDAPAAEVIVLSACETMRSPPVGQASATAPSSLGVFSFAGGARWVVATLWPAEDKTTPVIIAPFYRGMVQGGLDAPRALQAVRRDLIARGADPYVYANFLVFAHDINALRPR